MRGSHSYPKENEEPKCSKTTPKETNRRESTRRTKSQKYLTCQGIDKGLIFNLPTPN